MRRRELLLLGVIASMSGAPRGLQSKEPAGRQRDLNRDVTTVARRDRIDAQGLIVDAEVRSILDQLERDGYQLRDRAEILSECISATSLLAQKLRSPAGRAFAARVARLPQGFDRVEHLSRLPDGRMLLDRLIEGPDGERLIEYLVQSEGGRATGVELAAAPGGANFNQPTGHLYTLAQLIERLQRELAPPPKSRRAPKRSL